MASAYLKALGCDGDIGTITVDVSKYAELNPDGDEPTSQQVALGVAAALAHNAGVATETVPVMRLDDDVVVDVFHSCTPKVGH